jgi:hypothetical protein
MLHRPTQDPDLVGYGNPDVGEVVLRIREICPESVNDGTSSILKPSGGPAVNQKAERIHSENIWLAR